MSTNWSDCFNSDDVDTVSESWTERLLTLARAFIPNKVALMRPNDKPWYHNGLRLLKQKVKRCYNRAKKTGKPNHWDNYKALQAEYKTMLEQAELDYKSELNKKLCETRNTKVWWGTVKKILGKGSSETYPTIEDPVSKRLIYGNKEKSNLFNDFFLSHNNIELSTARLPSDCVDDSEQGTSIDHIDVLEADIVELISSINPHKATGPDGISPKILKEAGPAIVSSFTRLIKLSLKKCKIPKQWKKANVIPIHKKDKKDLLNNYRPISLLPVPSKILERIIFKQVYNHLHRNKLLSKDQSGFRPNDSTVNQLAFMYH